jgi:hypothetical protein
MFLKLRVPQNSNPIAPTKYIIFNSLRKFWLAGDPIANTPSAPAAGCSQSASNVVAVLIKLPHQALQFTSNAIEFHGGSGRDFTITSHVLRLQFLHGNIDETQSVDSGIDSKVHTSQSANSGSKALRSGNHATRMAPRTGLEHFVTFAGP